MTYRELFDTLNILTLIVLVVMVAVQGATIRSMRETNRTVNNTWSRHAWAIYDIAVTHGLRLPQPPYARPDWVGRHPGLPKDELS